jgi:hypothetical protein
MTTLAAILAAAIALAECGISTSPFGNTADPETLEECNGGWM